MIDHMSDADVDAWGAWWAKNHSFDWYAKENDGVAVGDMERLRIAQKAQEAYFAGLADGKKNIEWLSKALSDIFHGPCACANKERPLLEHSESCARLTAYYGISGTPWGTR